LSAWNVSAGAHSADGEMLTLIVVVASGTSETEKSQSPPLSVTTNQNQSSPTGVALALEALDAHRSGRRVVGPFGRGDDDLEVAGRTGGDLLALRCRVRRCRAREQT
jgi:hypothetical protein